MAKVYGASHGGYTAGWFDFRDRHFPDAKGDEVCFTYWDKGKREVDAHTFKWYFYLSVQDADRVAGQRFFDNLTWSMELTEDRKFARVYMQYYGENRRDLIQWMEERGITPLEADVPPVDRFMFDNEVAINPSPRVLYYDLETDTQGAGFDHVERHRILTIAHGHNPDDVEWLCANTDNDKGERELLDHFLNVVQDHDTLNAWSGDDYDEVVIRARCKLQSLHPNWRMVNFLDHLLLFKRYYQRDEEGIGVRVSYSLGNISEKCLGKGKVEGVQPNKIHHLWQHDRPKLEEYNKIDVVRMCELEEKYRYVEAHAVLAQVCNRFLSSKALKAAHLIDGFVLRYGSENGFRFPTRHHLKEEDLPEKIEGAWVMTPAPGLHEGVCDLDFSALYPMIIRAFNISPEVRLTDAEVDEMEKATGFDHPGNHGIAVAANGATFRTDTPGMFAAIVGRAVAGRDEHKQEALRLENEGQDGTHEHRMAFQRSVAWKQLSNSLCLGTMASPHSRYYDRDSGEAITTSAKAVEQSVVDLARESGIPAIYGDTDSGFFRCPKHVGIEFIPRAEAHVNKYLESRGATPGLIKLKLDAYFLRLVFSGKKHYAGKKDTGVWDVRGLALVRSDGCRYTRELMRRILDLMLEARTPTPEKAERIIKQWADRLFAGDLPVEEIVIAQSLGQSLSSYAKDPVHVRVARDMLKRGLEVYEGMKVPYVFVGRDDDDKLKAIHVDDYDGYYDPVHYWHRVFPATKSLLESAWPKYQGMWDAFEKYNPGAPQKELFSMTDTVKQPGTSDRRVTFRLHVDDQKKFKVLRRVMEENPGDHPVRLELRLENGEQVDLSTELKVKMVPGLIKELESVAGHRIHYEKEEWDG